MRVALLSPLFESVPPRLYGGTERVVQNLCRGLIDADVEVTVFASGDSSVEGKLVPVIEEALRLKGVTLADSAPYHQKMLSMVAERAYEFDVIHNHHDHWMLPLTRMTHVPILSTAHGRLDHAGLAGAYRAWPSHFVSISDAQRAPLPELAWAATVYNGIDIEAHAFQEKPGAYLAFLGRIHPEKRPEWAIEIAKKSGVPLKIAAKIEGAEGQAYYDSHVRKHVDGRFIEYVGEISESEKSEFLGNALGLAFPIDWPEPFGLVMVEALACGTPVLARPCGSVPEILRDGVTGYCDPSLERLAERVRDLPRIDRKGCRRWVEERFSLKRMTEGYIDVYRSLTEVGEVVGVPGRPGRDRAGSRPVARVDHRRWNLLHPVKRPADGNS